MREREREREREGEILEFDGYLIPLKDDHL